MARPMNRVALVINVVLLVLVLLAAAAMVWVWTRPEPEAGTKPDYNEKDGSYTVGSLPDDDAHDAVVAAVDGARLALSYDFRSLDEGLADAVSHMTDDFGAEFTRTFNGAARKQAARKRAVTRALVSSAGLVRIDGDDAVCLLYVNQVLIASKTMKKSDQPVNVTQNRVTIELEEVDGDWLLSGIKPI